MRRGERAGPSRTKNESADRDSRINPVRSHTAGRPLDENVNAAIRDTAWRLLRRDGFAQMSITQVAEKARVGRPAIYRRYRNKSELVAAVLADRQSQPTVIDTGNARDDLIAHLEVARRQVTLELAGSMLIEGTKHPELLRAFRRCILMPVIREVVAALERGKRRGEVRPDLDAELAVEAIVGAYICGRIAGGQPEKGWSTKVIDSLWPAFAP